MTARVRNTSRPRRDAFQRRSFPSRVRSCMTSRHPRSVWAEGYGRNGPKEEERGIAKSRSKKLKGFIFNRPSGAYGHRAFHPGREMAFFGLDIRPVGETAALVDSLKALATDPPIGPSRPSPNQINSHHDVPEKKACLLRL